MQHAERARAQAEQARAHAEVEVQRAIAEAQDPFASPSQESPYGPPSQESHTVGRWGVPQTGRPRRQFTRRPVPRATRLDSYRQSGSDHPGR